MTFVFSLVGGLLVAIALQLVLANMGVALGLTVLDWAPGVSSVVDSPEGHKGSSPDELSAKTPLPITHLLGFGVAAGFSTATFVAALVAVEFSLIVEPLRGSIFGLIVWATYWLLFIWVSSTTLSGIANSLIGSAIAGGQQLVSTVQSAIEATTGKSVAQGSTASTSKESEAVKQLSLKVSELADVQASFPNLLEQQKQALLAELSDHSTASDDADSPEPTAEVRIDTDSVVAMPTANSSPNRSLLSQLNLPSWQQLARRALDQIDLSDWDVETLLKKVPDSGLVQEYLPEKTAPAQLSASAKTTIKESARDNSPSEQSSIALALDDSAHQTQKEQHSAIKAIQDKLIAYCRYTNTDLLTPENLAQKVESQIEEQDLLVKSEVFENSLPLDFDTIAATLAKRKKLSEAKTKALITTLRQSWPAPPTKTSQPKADTTNFSLRSLAEDSREKLENHLKRIDWTAISLEDAKPSIRLALEEIEKAGSLRSINWQALVTRIQMPSQTKDALTKWLSSTWDDGLKATTHSTQTLTTQLSDKISYYLHHQDKSALQPQQLNQNLTQIVGSTVTAIAHLEGTVEENVSLPSFPALQDVLRTIQSEVLWDRETWQEALTERKDLTAEEIKSILTWGETVWQPKSQKLSHWIRSIQTEVEQAFHTLGKQAPDGHLARAAYEQVEHRVSNVQENLAMKASAMKEEIQQQANAARKQVAIAAWWLLIALVSSGSAAAGAGWLAAIY